LSRHASVESGALWGSSDAMPIGTAPGHRNIAPSHLGCRRPGARRARRSWLGSLPAARATWSNRRV